MNFETIEYLKSGNNRQKKAYQVLSTYQIFEKLSAYDPLLVGTIPLAIDIENSDLDVICCFTEQQEFRETVTRLFQSEKDFKIWDNNRLESEAVVASFRIDSSELEVFGQHIPTRQQLGYRHMIIEYKILQERGEDFRQEIITLKKQGIKTEPAFAKLLALEGNPYQELLKFE
ncbi:diadenosine tetraphosphate hydrolase [Siphonobacter sp. SORGH_AS_0500]|uniref:DUF4269 domain-containing protein n=1 Tax=Siphonobacter sp. SORGH_AS_0500 TaxID=1864824 RepID=UPI000CC3ECD7|nr:DUF4269 domain-containing protein [Siphonobacter sp. SORGH_AS_0500]PKK38257.1 diadenosine tetraphosphate hydrolase [Siphonobacter sp. SORGH_AS_0500]